MNIDSRALCLLTGGLPIREDECAPAPGAPAGGRAAARWAGGDVFIENLVRVGAVSCYMTALGVPFAGAVVGLGMEAFFREGTPIERIKHTALQAASYIPYYGSLVDLYYAYDFFFGEEKNNIAGAMYLFSAVVGLAASWAHCNRLVSVGARASAEGAARIIALRTARDMVVRGIKKTDAIAGGLRQGLGRDICGQIQGDLFRGSLPGVITRRARDILQLKDQQLIRAEMDRLSRDITRAILHQTSRCAPGARRVPFTDLHSARRAKFAVVSPIHPMMAWAQLRKLFYLGPARHTYLGRNLNRGVRQAGLERDYPKRAAWIMRRQIAAGERPLRNALAGAARKFVGRIQVSEQGVKGVESITHKVENGRFPYDMRRASIVTDGNKTTDEVAQFLLQNHPGSFMTRTARLAPRLDDANPYRATHVVIPHAGGAVEIQVMGRNMKAWKDEDDAFYAQWKRGHNVTRDPELVARGRAAYKLDGNGAGAPPPA